MSRKSWKKAELRALLARRATGERAADLAAECGVSERALRAAWRRSGLTCQPLYTRVSQQEGMLQARAYALHYGDGLTWEQVAEQLGYQDRIIALRSKVARWARRIGASPRWMGGTPQTQAQRVAKRRASRGRRPDVV